MKKFTLIAAMLVSFASAHKAVAQSFTIEKDTTKAYWVSGYSVELKLKTTNTSSSPIQLDWRLSSLTMDAGWTFGSACEPSGYCYSSTTPGLKDGSKTFLSDPMAAGYTGNFIVDFDADAAADNSKSIATIDISTGGGAIKKATFIGYKLATGISTSIIQDDEIAIFPNPASNYIDVLYSTNSDVKSVAIYNLIGKLVSVYKVSDKNSARCTFATDMPSGIYLVRIADSKGAVIATRKITRQ